MLTVLSDTTLEGSHLADPAVVDLIPVFRDELYASVHAITSTIRAGDHRTAQCLVRDLKVRAAAFGFASVVELAEKIVTSLDPQRLEKHVSIHLLRLRDLCRPAQTARTNGEKANQDQEPAKPAVKEVADSQAKA